MTDNAVVLFASADIETVKKLEQRMLDFLPGAKDVPHDVRMAMAQIAVAHNLDPFLRHVWAIPKTNRDKQVIGWELFIGINGYRESAHRTGEFWGRRFEDVTDQERKMAGAGANDFVLKCIVMRRKTGQQPASFDGIGIYKAGEFSKMNPLQCVRLRAERDAMKAAFPISSPFGVDIKFADEEGTEINGDHSPDWEQVEDVEVKTAEELAATLEKNKVILGRSDGDPVKIQDEAKAVRPQVIDQDHADDKLPTSGQEFFDWQKKIGISVKDVNVILGETVQAYVARGQTYVQAAREVLAQQKTQA
jgi:hypothetical protein